LDGASQLKRKFFRGRILLCMEQERTPNSA
jgi:hypothetical protein